MENNTCTGINSEFLQQQLPLPHIIGALNDLSRSVPPALCSQYPTPLPVWNPEILYIGIHSSG